MILWCNPIHHSSSKHYPYLDPHKYLLRQWYKRLHHRYLKKYTILWWKGNFCFIFTILIFSTIIFWYFNEYYKMNLWIKYLLISFKLGLTVFTFNVLSDFTYYTTQICFSWNVSNNSFILIQLWSKGVILLFQMGVCLLFNDILFNGRIKESY